jgi:hypothetical protein
MFDLLNDDLEECIDLLRKIQTANGSERWTLMAEYQIKNLREVEKTVELCHLLCYHYERVKEGKDL